jgi:hypothetical protein
MNPADTTRWGECPAVGVIGQPDGVGGHRRRRGDVDGRAVAIGADGHYAGRVVAGGGVDQ